MRDLPHTAADDETAGAGVMFSGLAIPYMLGALLIVLGLMLGGTFGFIVAFGSVLFLLGAVFVGVINFIGPDDEAGDRDDG